MTTFDDITKCKTKSGIPFKITSIGKVLDTKKWDRVEREMTFSWEIEIKFEDGQRYKLTIDNKDKLIKQEELKF